MTALRGAYRGVPTRVVDEEPKTRRLAYASSTATQTLISTVVDATGIAITFTVTQADLDNGRYACYVECETGWLHTASAAHNGVATLADEANVAKNSSLFAFVAASGFATSPILREVITTAGTYTRKLRLNRSGASGTFSHNAGAAESAAWIEARMVRVAV